MNKFTVNNLHNQIKLLPEILNQNITTENNIHQTEISNINNLITEVNSNYNQNILELMIFVWKQGRIYLW